MRKIRVSSTLTVYYDGQFWVGMFEHIVDGGLSVCRIVFGAEPSAEEIQRLVCDGWNELRFTSCVAFDETTSKLSSNPKRRQREASRELKQHGPSTKAQQALSVAREKSGQMRKSELRERRERERRERFERKQEKRKQKRRGK